jgi:hypothetical protein
VRGRAGSSPVVHAITYSNEYWEITAILLGWNTPVSSQKYLYRRIQTFLKCVHMTSLDLPLCLQGEESI